MKAVCRSVKWTAGLTPAPNCKSATENLPKYCVSGSHTFMESTFKDGPSRWGQQHCCCLLNFPEAPFLQCQEHRSPVTQGGDELLNTSTSPTSRSWVVTAMITKLHLTQWSQVINTWFYLLSSIYFIKSELSKTMYFMTLRRHQRGRFAKSSFLRVLHTQQFWSSMDEIGSYQCKN